VIARLGVGALVAVVSAASAAAQQPTFSSRLDAVRIDVLVTDNGRLVQGLTAADFEVLDNGIAQQIDLVLFEQLPLNVMLALDLSASLAGDGLQHLRQATDAVLGGLQSRDRAGLLTFNHRLTIREPLTADAARVRDALQAVTPEGQTSLVDGVYASMTMAEDEAGRDLLIVFSDGLDTTSWLRPEAVLEAAQRSDVTAYGAAVRGVRRDAFLRDLAEQTGGSVLEVDSRQDLGRAFTAILDEFRNRYVVSYSPRGVATDGWHKLQVRVKNRRATVRARTGYFARN
jgi:VWFA-related protein